MKLLRLDDVGRVYQMGEVQVDVLRRVTLDIHEPEIVAIVGPSGSGKTTILNLLGGLDQPTSGRIWFHDQELTRASARELTNYRRNEVGFVFQFFNLVPTLTARENVMIATDLCERPRDVDEVLDMVELSDRAHHFPSQMSGGEQQRVAIARAIAKNPRLLLCDEPTGSLDFDTAKNVLTRLVDLNRRLQTTVVLITHNIAIAEISDRVIQLRSGEITDIVTHAAPKPPEEIVW